MGKPENNVPDEPQDLPKKAPRSSFRNWQVFAYGGIFVVAGIAGNINGFFSERVWVPPSTSDEVAVFVARIVLFVELLVLAIRWIIATLRQLDMWDQWLVHPFPSDEPYWAIIGLSVALGLLLAFAHKILIISGLMTAYLLVNYWSQGLANEHLRRALQGTRKVRLSQTKAKVLQFMEDFWLRRPQLARIATMMAFSLIAFVLSLKGAAQAAPRKYRLEVAAYVVLILTILISEVIVTRWRLKLKKDIKSVFDPEESVR
jgi:hypothetical protein